jgi:tetratricopeptide (TPR) repeat protein
MPALGFSSAQVGNAFERAATLARQSRSGQQRCAVISGLFASCISRADHAGAEQLACEILEIAAEHGNEAFAVEAHFALGASLFWQAKFVASLKHLELGSAEDDFSPLNIVGADTTAFALAYRANCLWHLGYPDQAAKSCSRALQRGDSLNHPFTAATIRLGAVQTLMQMSRDLALQEAERMIAISVENGFPFQETVARIYRNSGLVHCRPERDLLAEIYELVHRLEKIGAMTGIPIHLADLAKGYGDMGAPEQGLAFLEEAFSGIEHTAECQMLAELHRLEGELLLLQASANAWEAEQQFRSAIDIAREQQAKSWELRATMSLARLLPKQDQREEARSMLAQIFGWFTEGFDTPDLKEARALLDELNH